MSEPGTCGMKDCTRPSVETLEIDCHPDIRAEIGLPPEIVKLSVCVEHALMWKIGWLFGEYGIGVTSQNIKRFIFRMMAEASEC